jgi:hypothetical protein
MVNIPGSTSVVAGEPFLFTVQAVDASGSPLPSYTGPTTFTAASSPPDPQSIFTGTLNSVGFGFLLATLKTASSYTLTVTAGSLSGTSDKITVTPGAANYFAVSGPASATTGKPFDVTVTAFDHFGNVATGYTGAVNVTSTDPAATLAGKYAFTSGAGKDNGVHTFSVTLGTGGAQTITATDTASTNPVITGTSSPIAAHGLVVAGTPAATPTGFTVNFSKPFVPGDLALYGPGLATASDVTLVGKVTGPIDGTLLIDPANTGITFKATSSSLTAFFGTSILPDDTYTLTLVSGKGSHGFMDALGSGLDGANNGGHADYTTTFTMANAGKPILSVPDFARGPDGGSVIKVPNDTAHGIPITLMSAVGVTDVSFTLSYNPTLLTVTGASTQDASSAGSGFALAGAPTIIDATHATAGFSFHDDKPQSGTVVLGDILANVPNSAASSYKAKELLGLGAITLNGAAFTGVSAGGVHVNAYFGDVTGNGTIDGLDLATAGNVARGAATGFAAYQVLDPAIVGDVAGDNSVDAGDVSDLAAFTAHVLAPVIPVIPVGVAVSPGGADPTLSLGPALRQADAETGRQGEGEEGRDGPSGVSPVLPISSSPLRSFTIPILLDDPHPEGSTGMTEAVLALKYDPSVLSVSSSDITLGSIPSLGQDWRLTSVVDQVTGQIAITLYSTTPITAGRAGSLVDIAFHVREESEPGAGRPLAATVDLVHSVVLNDGESLTQVDDVQGPLVLGPGVDSLVVQLHPLWRKLLSHRRPQT